MIGAVLQAAVEAYARLEIIRETRHTRMLLEPYIRPGWLVLDLGCGTAHATAAIGQLLAGQVVGADVADLRRVPLPRFCLYDGLRVPFRTRSFDLVVLAFVLHHVPADDQRKLLREAGRVSRGLVAIMEDTPRHRLDAWMGRRHAERFRRRVGSGKDFRFHPQHSWLNIFREEGFSVLESEPVGRLARGFSQPWARHFFVLEINA